MAYGIFDDHRRVRVANLDNPHSHEFPTRERAATVARQLRRVYPGMKLRIVDLDTEKWIADQEKQGEREMGQ